MARPLLDEPDHEGVLPQAQLLEVGELDEVSWQSLESVLVQLQGVKVRELGELFRQVGEFVVTENEGGQLAEFRYLGWKLLQLVASQVEVVQAGRGGAKNVNLAAYGYALSKK